MNCVKIPAACSGGDCLDCRIFRSRVRPVTPPPGPPLVVCPVCGTESDDALVWGEWTIVERRRVCLVCQPKRLSADGPQKRTIARLKRSGRPRPAPPADQAAEPLPALRPGEQVCTDCRRPAESPDAWKIWKHLTGPGTRICPGCRIKRVKAAIAAQELAGDKGEEAA